jgi:hypothetical protein
MAGKIVKWAAVGIVVGLAVGGFGAGTAQAAKGPSITATGDAACSGSGKVKALGYGASPSFHAQVAAKLKMGCAGSTGNPAVTIKSAKVGGIMIHNGDCTPDGPWSFAIVWKAKGGRMTSTNVYFSNSTVTPTGWTAPGPGGTATVTGSYAGTNTSSVTISGPSSTIQGWCTQPPGRKPPKLVGFLSFNLFL